MIRRSEATGEMLLGVRDAGPWGGTLEDLASALERDHPELAGVVRIHGWRGGRGGSRVEVIVGRGWIEERVGGLAYRIPAATFLQVSARAATELVEIVAGLARPGAADLLDLYCGVGVHAHSLTRSGLATEAVGVDADRPAVECARDVARRAGIPARFVRSDVGRYLARARRQPDLLVANPPRTGMGREVASAIRDLGPERVVVVSCEAATLARDLRVLLDGGRYRLERVVPIDLFPQSAHVETVSLLVRR